MKDPWETDYTDNFDSGIISNFLLWYYIALVTHFITCSYFIHAANKYCRYVGRGSRVCQASTKADPGMSCLLSSMHNVRKRKWTSKINIKPFVIWSKYALPFPPHTRILLAWVCSQELLLIRNKGSLVALLCIKFEVSSISKTGTSNICRNSRTIKRHAYVHRNIRSNRVPPEPAFHFFGCLI